jgi:hypothetical protein
LTEEVTDFVIAADDRHDEMDGGARDNAVGHVREK